MNLSFSLLTTERLQATLRLVEEFYQEESLPFERSTIFQALQELLESPSFGKLWHIELDEQPIGYLLLTSGFILEFGGRQYVLDELYVRPNFRRRGFGTRAIQFAESVCREDGIRVLRLEVDQTSTRTISLYRKVGFRLQHRHTMTRLLH